MPYGSKAVTVSVNGAPAVALPGAVRRNVEAAAGSTLSEKIEVAHNAIDERFQQLVDNTEKYRNSIS